MHKYLYVWLNHNNNKYYYKLLNHLNNDYYIGFKNQYNHELILYDDFFIPIYKRDFNFRKRVVRSLINFLEKI